MIGEVVGPSATLVSPDQKSGRQFTEVSARTSSCRRRASLYYLQPHKVDEVRRPILNEREARTAAGKFCPFDKRADGALSS